MMRDLMALYGLSDAMPLLPRLCQPTEVVGHVTPAAASATGLARGYAGRRRILRRRGLGPWVGCRRRGAASIVLGSWSINQVFADTPARDPNVFMVAAFGPGRFANMDNSATSAANLEWYVRTLIERDGHHGDAFALVNDLVGQRGDRPGRPDVPPVPLRRQAWRASARRLLRPWRAGMTKATCCARFTKVSRSNIAAMSRC